MSITGRSLTLDDLIAFNEELVALLRAGLPLEAALRPASIRKTEAATALRAQLAHRLEQGSSLADAVAEESTLPALYRAVAAAGLHCGRLPTALEGMTLYLQFVQSAKSQLTTVLLYPLLTIPLMYLGLWAGMAYFVPRLLALMSEFHVRPNAFLRFVEWGAAHRNLCAAIPPLLLLLFLMWREVQGRRTAGRGYSWLGWLRFFPGVRKLQQGYELASFSRLTALLVEHEVPLPTALDLARETLSRKKLRSDLGVLATRLRQGMDSPSALSGLSGLPQYFCWLLGMGYQQGRVAEVLNEAGAHYQNQSDAWSAWLRVFLPALLFVGLAGTLLLAYALVLFIPFREILLQLT